MLTDAASKAVLVSAPEGLFVFDREGRIVFVNSQIDELFGYAPGELLGQSLEVLLPVLFWEMREQQSAASTPAPGLPIERYGLEQMGYCKNRAEVRVQVSVGPVEAQARPLECCIVRQIAAPEEQSQALNDSNDQFRQMVENSHDILTIRDADGRVRYISPSIHSVLGYKQEEIIGSTGFELLHPEDRSAVENARSEFWKNPRTPCAPNAPSCGIRSTHRVSRRGSLFTRRWQRRRTPLDFRRNRNRASAILAHGAHGKEMIVGGYAFQERFTRRGGKIIDCPARITGLAPQNLESCALGIIFGSPRHFRIRSDGPS